MQIYIHVPFCVQKCRYCAFFSKVPAGQETETYTRHLLREIALYGERLGRLPVETVFFGGGTPSLLGAAFVDAALGALAKTFSLARGAEITLEGNPDSLLMNGVLEGLARSGVNRLSIGVQSLDDARLRFLGRPHNAAQAESAVHEARAAGFGNIGVDLIWGLPDQTPQGWLRELKHVCGRLNPEHISAYGLTLEPETPLAAAGEAGETVVADERTQARLFIQGGDLLEEAGYLHYEVSNFAKMGYQCRHNLGYWEGLEYLGLGPGAVSTVAGRRWTNPASIRQWCAAVNTGRPGRNAEELDAQARFTETVMLSLRTARGLRLKAYEEMTGRSFFQDHQALVNLLHQMGLIRMAKGRLRFTRNGMLVSDAIVARILADTPPLAAAKPEASRQEAAWKKGIPYATSRP